MSDQESFFDKLRPDPYGGKAPSVNVETSREAADSIQAVLSALEARVLSYVRSRGDSGSTCDEAEVALGMRHQTCSARFRGLVLKDRLLVTETKRKTRTGRRAFVYVVPEVV